MKKWFLIETEKEYKEANSRFEEIYQATKDDPEYKEMQLLAFLINKYEKANGIFQILILLNLLLAAWKI
jgi:hypothetical protein